MKLIQRLKGSAAKWYILGIASAAAAGWISRETRPPLPVSVPDSSSVSIEVPPSSEAIELVHTARALERAGDSVQARAAYLEAASKLSPISDYLRLRAVQLTVDSAERRKLYAAVSSSPARDQVRITEARVLERMGEFDAAAGARKALGQWGEAFRLRLLGATDQAARRPVLQALVAWVADFSATPEAAAVAAQAVPYVRELRAADLVILARSSKSTAMAAFYNRANGLGARLTTADHASWGEALYGGGRYREAATRLRRVTSGSLLPRSTLLRGRSLLRSGQAGGKAVLEELIRRFPDDSVSTPTALFLLGDLARDAADYTTARRHWSKVTERFPLSPEAPRARFLVGLVLYTGGNRVEAAKQWDSLFSGGNGREEALSGGYWAGRALSELGDSAGAKARWRQVLTRSRLSYYSRLSYKRLGLPDSTILASDDRFANSPYLEAARQRLNLLVATGLTPELGMEITWLVGKAGDDLTTVVGTAQLLREHHRAAYSAQLGWRALEAGAAESRTYRLIFPVMFHDPLVAASRAERVEPALAAALIRQESLFDSMATSRAGARGLMQIMPTVGRELARSARKSPWHADSLYQPATNLQLGTAHLAWALERYSGLERTLAAYNAGGSRVTRWAQFPGSADREVFVEWIPFPETRSYVRTVLRNLEFYRGLYSWN